MWRRKQFFQILDTAQAFLQEMGYPRAAHFPKLIIEAEQLRLVTLQRTSES